MDISIEKIVEFYNEQLVNHLASGQINGERVARTADQILYAHVHSFFLHWGSARDYLAALIATRVGKDPMKTDSMAYLIKGLLVAEVSSDAILKLLFDRKYIQHSPMKIGKFEPSGWLKETSNLRNLFVHKRPYGQRSLEKRGRIEPISTDFELYRYYRPLVLENEAIVDVLEEIVRSYKVSMSLFYDVALATHYDTIRPVLTDEDIVSFVKE